MNPHLPHSSSPNALFRSIWQQRSLILQMTKREVLGRYKGSVFGIVWSFFNPLMLLSVYTFVFSFVFKARWGIDETESKVDFALVLFLGLIIHALFAEVINTAPGIIVGNANYVKKVVFPLDTLIVVSFGVSLFHATISLLVLFLAFFILKGLPSLTVFYFPIAILPLFPFILGVGWLLAALGVYIRDIRQIIGILTTVLLFLSPVFYPIDSLPSYLQTLLYINPLTLPIEQARAVIIFGENPDWIALIWYSFVSVFICWSGYWWFQKTRKGFADVI